MTRGPVDGSCRSEDFGKRLPSPAPPDDLLVFLYSDEETPGPVWRVKDKMSSVAPGGRAKLLIGCRSGTHTVPRPVGQSSVRTG